MNTGIKHIEFWTSDLVRALAFYTELFSRIGWSKIDSNGFSDGHTKIYFIQQNVTFIQNVGPRHLCFLASSEEVVNNVGRWLNETGAVIIRGPVRHTYEGKQGYTVDFKDPDGYILEVATRSM